MSKEISLKVKHGKKPHIDLPNLQISYYDNNIDKEGKYLVEFWNVETNYHSLMGDKNQMIKTIEENDLLIKEIKGLHGDKPKNNFVEETIEILLGTKKFYNKYKNRRIRLSKKEIEERYNEIKPKQR